MGLDPINLATVVGTFWTPNPVYHTPYLRHFRQIYEMEKLRLLPNSYIAINGEEFCQQWAFASNERQGGYQLAVNISHNVMIKVYSTYITRSGK